MTDMSSSSVSVSPAVLRMLSLASGPRGREGGTPSRRGGCGEGSIRNRAPRASTGARKSPKTEAWHALWDSVHFVA